MMALYCWQDCTTILAELYYVPINKISLLQNCCLHELFIVKTSTSNKTQMFKVANCACETCYSIQFKYSLKSGHLFLHEFICGLWLLWSQVSRNPSRIINHKLLFLRMPILSCMRIFSALFRIPFYDINHYVP